jgi:hypothetical protein
MSLASREYVCLNGLGGHEECARIASNAYFNLKEMNDKKLILASKLQIHDDGGSLFASGIDSDEVKEVTQKDPPLVWLNITYDSENYNEEIILSFCAKFNFHEMYEYDSGKPVPSIYYD